MHMTYAHNTYTYNMNTTHAHLAILDGGAHARKLCHQTGAMVPRLTEGAGRWRAQIPLCTMHGVGCRICH